VDIHLLIDALEELLESGSPVPLSGKRLVSVGEAVEIIRQMRLNIPEDIKEAEKILADRDDILSKAEAESQRMIKSAEDAYTEMVDNHEIISAAYKQANEIIANAQLNAQDMKAGAYEYTEKLLDRIEQVVYDTAKTVNANRREIESLRE